MSHGLLDSILAAYPRAGRDGLRVRFGETGSGDLPAWFDVSGLAAASMGAAGQMLARHRTLRTGEPTAVTADRRLASFWFGMTVRPQGWQMPPAWDPIAGDYRAKDRWIRLHTNAPHHRAAALSVLGDHADRASLEPAVATWEARDLERAVVAAGGCAAVMHDLHEWSLHPQGQAVAAEPLVHWRAWGEHAPRRREAPADRPLAGLKVLDLTRVLAGPVAGRFLAGYGAGLLRIDPPDWDEPGVVPEVTLGKRCARLDLKTPEGRRVFETLLAEADVLLHGYRADALERLGYGGERLWAIRPGLIDVSLNAYGWTGPWATRRGFDSLVQMSSGIADYGMRLSGAAKPTPLPVQALDMATGYLLAAAVLHALNERMETGTVWSARLSLARVAHLLIGSKRGTPGDGMAAETEADWDARIEATDWGPARRPLFPVAVEGAPARWNLPARELGWSAPMWG